MIAGTSDQKHHQQKYNFRTGHSHVERYFTLAFLAKAMERSFLGT
jgi:hypothetical protein